MCFEHSIFFETFSLVLIHHENIKTHRVLQTGAHACPHITFGIYNASALPVPCIHRFMFLDVFFGVALGRVQDDFGAQHGPNLSPCWSHVDHFLGHFWVLLWHLHFRCDFDRFLIHFRPPEASKNIQKPLIF